MFDVIMLFYIHLFEFNINTLHYVLRRIADFLPLE